MYNTTIDFEQRLKDMYGENVPFYDYSEFISINKPMSAKCINCHEETKGPARKFIRPDSPFKCGYCSKRVRNTQSIKKAIYELVGDEYTLLTEYISAHKPLTLHHKICGNDYETTSNQFISKNQRCTFCSASNGEQLIQTYLIKHNITFLFDNMFFGESKCVGESGNSLRFDFQILNSSGNVCGIIEFDGNQHVQDIKHFNRLSSEYQKSDLIKNEFCLSENIPLLRLPISELLRNQNTKLTSSNIDISILYNRLGVFLNGLGEDFKLFDDVLDRVFNRQKMDLKATMSKELKDLMSDSSLIWKDIPLFEGLYKLSNKGDVVRLRYDLKPLRSLNPFFNSKKSSNLSINLTKNSVAYSYILAKLVYSVFNDIPYSDLKTMFITYTDNNNDNCSLENINLLTKDEAFVQVKNTHKRTIYRVEPKTNKIKVYFPLSLAKADGFDPSAIVKCCKGKTKSHKGYFWFYADDFKNKKIT